MFHIHRAERADALVTALAEILAQPAGDPFAAQLIAVPTRGMERWLIQQMSSRLGARPGRADGVCANIQFPFPGALIDEVIATATGTEGGEDPWRPGRMIWPLVEVVDAHVDELWLAPLTGRRDPQRPPHETGSADQAAPGERRLARVQQIAHLFDHYATWRPAMLRAWARGEAVDGSARELPGATAWQAELWLALRRAIGVPSFPERLDAACARLREQPELVALPDRLALFGLTRLPSSHLQVLRALAAHREVSLFVLHPSPALWDSVSVRDRQPLAPRALDATAGLAHNSLLASWGRDARELQLVLRARHHATAGGPDTGRAAGTDPGASAATPSADVTTSHHHTLAEERSDTLLARIQADVRADRAAPGPAGPGADDTRMILRAEDRSLQVHACHGRPRQVQALHEAILHALAEDPTLEPRDVIVMCPDIETFAPLITATFGAARREEHDAEPGAARAGATRREERAAYSAAGAAPIEERTDLRVRLADRSLRATNPVLGVIARLVELADARVTASQLLDLIDTDPVRRRFELRDDELAQIRDWMLASGIHWGLDDKHRDAYKLGRVQAGTWHAGLSRILLGVALSEAGERLFGPALPVDDVGSDAIDLAGRFAELIDRVTVALDELAGPHTPVGWTQALSAAADALTSCSDRDAWQRLELGGLLAAISTEAGGAADSTGLTLGELRVLLGDRLAGRPTRANFRTGHLTVCTLVPMRSVPHRVVCLLGLDDGAFPRRSVRNGDDVLLADPVVGDRDPRSEDRQMLLDALLAARERLIVTFTGNDECTNAPRPPAVVVGELLEVVDATARCEDGAGARERVLIHHPLQPFDERNFLPGAILPARPWSFDPVALEGAQALRGPRSAPAPLLRTRLPEAPASVLALPDLVRFVQRPVRAFLSQRLGISIAEQDQEVRDALPVELDPLARWGVGERLLEDVLTGIDPRAALLAEIARGTLPPGELGRAVIQEVWPGVQSIAAHARAYAESPPPRSVETVVPLPGLLLTGTVSGVRGNVLLTASYSTLNARHRLSAWVRLLALTAAHPEAPFRAITVGRAGSGSGGSGSGGSGSGGSGSGGSGSGSGGSGSGSGGSGSGGSGSGSGGSAGGDGTAQVAIAQIPALAADAADRRKRARALLADLADLRARGMREPLPLPCLTSAAYAQAVAMGSSTPPLMVAQKAWKTAFGSFGEDREPEHQLVFGVDAPLTQLLGPAPLEDEQGDGWHAEETTRFGRLARRLWDSLLASESIELR